jgi:hypothetical protein
LVEECESIAALALNILPLRTILTLGICRNNVNNKTSISGYHEPTPIATEYFNQNLYQPVTDKSKLIILFFNFVFFQIDLRSPWPILVKALHYTSAGLTHHWSGDKKTI